MRTRPTARPTPRGRTEPARALAPSRARRQARGTGVGLRPARPRVLALVHASSAPLEPAASARRALARARRSAFRETPVGGARPLLRPLLRPGVARPDGGGNGRGRRRGGLRREVPPQPVGSPAVGVGLLPAERGLPGPVRPPPGRQPGCQFSSQPGRDHRRGACGPGDTLSGRSCSEL